MRNKGCLAALSVTLAACGCFAVDHKPEWVGLLDGAVWPDVKPQSYDYTADDAFTMKGSYFKGRFVSAAADVADSAKKGRYLIRRVFSINKKVANAWLQGVGDQSVQFRINAKPVMNSWFDTYSPRKRTEVENVTKFLKQGENVLVGEYKVGNRVFHGVARSFPGGVVADLTIEYEDGSFEVIGTDERCESSTNFHKWVNVVVSDPPPVPPRAARLRYIDFSRPQENLGGGPETSKVCGGMPLKFRYCFRGPAPDGEFSLRLEMKKGTETGKLAWQDEFVLGPSAVSGMDGGIWKIEFAAEMPRSAAPGRYAFAFESNSIYIRSGEKMSGTVELEAAMSGDRGFERPIAATVTKVNGTPEVHIDGRPFPLFWGSVPLGRRPDGKPRHSSMPINAVTVYASLADWHPKTGVYDFTVFDLMAEKHRRENPNAYFIWDLTVYPRPDFAKEHPGEIVTDDKGEIAYTKRMQWSYASEKAMAELKDMIENAIRYLAAAPYVNRILGFRICSGVTIEWLGWECKSGRSVDFSEPNKRAWADFAAKYYPELKNPHVPSYEELVELDTPLDILWDRRRHLNAIAYMDYNSWIIARDALELCAHAKLVLGSLGLKRLVGTYYGYTFFLNSSGCTQWRGHFALREMLANNRGNIDFLMSPQSYGQRRLGETCGEMKPFSTLSATGIMSLIEDDTRTHNRLASDWRGYHQTLTPSQTEAVLKRNAGIRLCQGSAPFLYALVTGYEYNSPECAEAGRAIFDIRKFALERGVSRNAEVALVASERSVTAMPSLARRGVAETGNWIQRYGHDGKVVREKERRSLLHGEIFNAAHTRFARSGASIDYLLAEDLCNYSGNYKLYVFLNQFVFDDALLNAVERIRNRGATILWLYAPGFSNSNSLEDMKKLTGIEFAACEGPDVAAVTVKSPSRLMGMPEARVAKLFYPVRLDEVLGTYSNGKPGLARVRTGASESYFSGTWQLDVEFIRHLMRKAGVHLFSDSLDPMEANDGLFTLHARTPGIKSVRLKRKATVVDVFSRRIVGRNVDSFSFDAPLHTSHLFYFGPDAERFLDRTSR